MQHDAWTDADWRSAVNLLLDLGFTLVSEDREQGCLTVKVP